MKTFVSLAVLGSFVLATGAASAAVTSIPVTNGNFETGDFSTGPTTSFVPSWTSTTNNNSDYSWGEQRPGAPAGNGSGANGTNTYAFFWNTGNNQFMYQDLGVATVAGDTYTVSGYIQPQAAGTGGSIQLASFTGGAPGAVLVASPEVGGASSTGSTTWTPVTIQYTALTSGTDLGIELYRNDGSQQTNLFFDEITASVSAPDTVPEPASLGLLGLGAVALLRRRKSA